MWKCASEVPYRIEFAGTHPNWIRMLWKVMRLKKANEISGLYSLVLCRIFHEFLDENLWIRWFVLIRMVFSFSFVRSASLLNVFGVDTFQFCIWNGIVHDQLLERMVKTFVCRHFLCGKFYANLFDGVTAATDTHRWSLANWRTRLVAQTRIDKNGVRNKSFAAAK